MDENDNLSDYVTGLVADSVHEGIVLTDSEGRFTYVNQAFADLLGYRRDELIGRRSDDVSLSEYQRLLEAERKRRRTGESSDFEIKLRHNDGRSVPVRVHAALHGDIRGIGAAAVITDLSRQRSVERQLRRRERELSSLINHVQGFFYRCLADEQWTMIFMSSGCREITGYDPAEIIDNKIICFNEVIDPDYRDEVRRTWNEAFRARGVFEDEYPILTKQGERRWVWERGWPVYDKAGEIRYLEGFIADITGRREMEARLQESEHRYRLLFESLHDAVLLVDPEYRILLANPTAFEQVGGSGMVELEGRNALDFLSPEYLQLVQENMAELISHGSFEGFELRIKRFDGSDYPARISTAMLSDSQGSPGSIMVVIRDLTEEREAEEKRRLVLEREQELKRSQVLGRLAGGIAHYFNNMLGVIMGYTDMLMADTDDRSDSFTKLQEIFEASTRSAELVRQLLALSGRQLSRPSRIEVDEFFADHEQEFADLLGEQIDLSVSVKSRGLCVRIDPEQLRAVLINLLTNSRDALPAGGSAEVTAEESEGRICFTVTDNGEGMDQQTLEHVYEPFYTTKGEMTTSTGLGLSVVQGIIQQYSGELKISSREREGTTVKIYLPDCCPQDS